MTFSQQLAERRFGSNTAAAQRQLHYLKLAAAAALDTLHQHTSLS
jgi:hypothetical protein